MCKCLPRATVTMLGLVVSIIVGLISISPIFFSGFDYQQTDLLWASEGPWRSLAAAKVSAVVVLFVSFLLGLLTFGVAPQSKGVQIIFIMFNFLSTILTFAVGVYALVASQISNNDLTQTCKVNYKGMFDNFRYLDEIFTKANTELCSDGCKCNLTDELALEEFEQSGGAVFDEYNNKINDNKAINGAVNFQNCSNYESIMLDISKDKIFNDKIGSIAGNKKEKFATYWKRIEEKFNCAGWCQKYYKDESSNNRTIIKYLFSDINRGIPKSTCMNPFKNWMVRMLKAYGGLMVIDSFFQGVVWVLAITLFGNIAADDDSQRKPRMNEEDEKKKVNSNDNQQV